MNRLIAMLALLLAALLAAPAAAQQQDWTGDWHGALAVTNAQGLRLIVTITAAPGGGFSGQLESLDQAPGLKIPIDTLAIADGRLTFAMLALGATYEGRWDPPRNRFVGTFTQGGTPLPLDLARGAGTAQPTISGLDGRWATRIERNGVQLRLILRVATSALGTIALLDSPDMMANGLAVTGLAR
ncbi:MAG TPA: hypothetical protein VMS43_05300, partial [Allosphingosinicella sp.]|nr:hypothetical protein [Allosphingosinicella sp.]